MSNNKSAVLTQLSKVVIHKESVPFHHEVYSSILIVLSNVILQTPNRAFSERLLLFIEKLTD